MSEYLLRCRGEEYDTKIRLHKEMNFNMIRNWLGSTTDDEFYQYCDRYGIMVWDDFWINSNPNLPYDLNAFNNNMIEKSNVSETILVLLCGVEIMKQILSLH